MKGNDMYRIEELITIASEKGASDVHLIAGLPPKCRIDGLITNLTEETLTHEDCEEYGRQLAGKMYRRSFIEGSWISVLPSRDAGSVSTCSASRAHCRRHSGF